MHRCSRRPFLQSQGISGLRCPDCECHHQQDAFANVSRSRSHPALHMFPRTHCKAVYLPATCCLSDALVALDPCSAQMHACSEITKCANGGCPHASCKDSPSTASCFWEFHLSRRCLPASITVGSTCDATRCSSFPCFQHIQRVNSGCCRLRGHDFYLSYSMMSHQCLRGSLKKADCSVQVTITTS